MILPIGDEPNPRETPWINWLLIAANVGVYLFLTLPLSLARPDPSDPVLREYVAFLTRLSSSHRELSAALANVSRWDLFVFAHGFRPAFPSLSTIFGSMFLHSGLLHLAGNMLFLWIYGDNVEARLGRVRYLFVYLATGGAAAIVHGLLSLDSPVPTVGASGAISGVLGFYFLWFPKNRVKIFVMLFPFFMDVVRVPARIVLGLFVLVDNLLPFILQRSATGVAYGAHLGGFAAGLAIAAMAKRSPQSDGGSPLNSDPVHPVRARASSAELVDQLVASADYSIAAEAFAEIFPTLERTRVSPAAYLTLARWLDENAPPEVSLAVYQRYLADHPDGPWLDRAQLGAGLSFFRLGDRSRARPHLESALGLTTDPEVVRVAREALAAIG